VLVLALRRCASRSDCPQASLPARATISAIMAKLAHAGGKSMRGWLRRGSRRPLSLPSDVEKHLPAADWSAIQRELAGYAAHLVRNFVWRTGQPVDLAKGWDARDIAALAIKRLHSGERRWNPARVGLRRCLRGIVRSLVSNLADSPDNRLQRRFPQGEEAEELCDHIEYDARRHDQLGVLPQPPPDPEGAVVGPETGSDGQRVQHLIEELKRTGDHIAARVMETSQVEGETRPRHLSRLCDMKRCDINNALKRARRTARRLERR
jgi:hypothetical protein